MTATFDAAARQLVAEQGDRLPDLSGCTVLVPHHHVRAPFLASLRRALALPVFLPPQVLTLPALAASAGDNVCQTDGQRLAALHAILVKVDWVGEAGLWPLAQAMLDLLNELDDARLAPPGDFGDFAAQIERASRRTLNQPLEREARLVFDLWRAFHLDQPGSRGAYALGLARWLDRAPGPLYTLGLTTLSRMEQHFLADCQARIGCIPLPVTEPYPERRELLDLALRPGPEAPALRERALLAGQSAAPLNLAMVGAPDLEAEARAVAGRIKDWLREGRREIAIIALDRLAARRLRALLERDNILIQDETGWTFSTATVSHVVDRWLALIQDDFYHLDLLDLLKSPFVFADLPVDARQAAVAALERAVARHNVAVGMARYPPLAVGEAAGARPMLDRLGVAAGQFGNRRRRTLSGWLNSLLGVLDIIGAGPAIAIDPAGRQLLELLRRLAAELAGDGALHTLSRWRAWLNLQLDRATFTADEIESPIRLTHLAAARLRDFEAVAVLGADQGHLPPKPSGELFSDGVRVQLGLPGQGQRRDEVLADLIEVLSRSPAALLTWQTRLGLDPNPRSTWLDILSVFHQLAFGDDLARVPPSAPEGPIVTAAKVGPARLSGLPGRLSASAWQTLVACPYRYFARHGLGLGEGEEVVEAMEKSDYGERVHDILKRFHAEHPVLAEHDRASLLADLTRITEEAFRAREREEYLARAWRLRWQGRLADYLDWALEREKDGWRWQEGEIAFERELELGNGGAVILHGRIDRLDRGPGGTAVLDYKTQSRTVLRGKLKVPGEHVQLAFYGWLTGAGQAGLVALDDEKIGVVDLPGSLAEAAREEGERMAATLAAVAGGAPLSAHGAPETCQWCEMRGLCRRA